MSKFGVAPLQWGREWTPSLWRDRAAFPPEPTRLRVRARRAGQGRLYAARAAGCLEGRGMGAQKLFLDRGVKEHRPRSSF